MLPNRQESEGPARLANRRATHLCRIAALALLVTGSSCGPSTSLSVHDHADRGFRDLIMQLDCDDPEVRDLAEQRLLAAGPEVLESLAGHSRCANLGPELRARLARVMRSIRLMRAASDLVGKNRSLTFIAEKQGELVLEFRSTRRVRHDGSDIDMYLDTDLILNKSAPDALLEGFCTQFRLSGSLEIASCVWRPYGGSSSWTMVFRDCADGIEYESDLLRGVEPTCRVLEPHANDAGVEICLPLIQLPDYLQLLSLAGVTTTGMRLFWTTENPLATQMSETGLSTIVTASSVNSGSREIAYRGIRWSLTRGDVPGGDVIGEIVFDEDFELDHGLIGDVRISRRLVVEPE